MIVLLYLCIIVYQRDAFVKGIAILSGIPFGKSVPLSLPGYSS
ncbi:MAG: hypothetical protein ANABAC_3219 [Anaerolineae bacterium]|nr:MAG: hypothetical protein ANABAC_3219 [Anaerolineae bacterium]